MFWLALGYPLLAHLAVLTHDRRLEWLALVWLLGIAMGGALIQRRLWAWGALLAGAGLLYWLVIEGNGLYALYIPPAAIPAALFMLFALSLRAGEIPLVTRIARLMHDGPFPTIWSSTRATSRSSGVASAPHCSSRRCCWRCSRRPSCGRS